MVSLPSRKEATDARDALLDQLDTTSVVWKTLEEILRLDRYGIGLDLIAGSDDKAERTRGRASYIDMLLNFPQTQEARKKVNHNG